MSNAKRAAKRFQRENRKNKGMSTAAKIQAHAARVRDARHTLGNYHGGMDEAMLLLAASMLGGRR